MDAGLQARLLEAKHLAAHRTNPARLALHQSRLELMADLLEAEHRNEEAEHCRHAACLIQQRLEAYAARGTS